MPNVIVDKDKLDVLANAISAKSGEALTLTLDEMVDAVDGISTGGGGTPTLETVTKTYTASEQGAVTDTITPSNGYDGIGEVDVTVNAIPFGTGQVYVNTEYYNDNGRKWQTNSYFQMTQDGWVNGTSDNVLNRYNAIATGTSVTPTESAQTIGGANTMMEGAVTVNAIPSTYVGTGITRRSSSDLTASGATVSVPSGFYENNASKAVASGSATPASSISGTSATVSTGTNTLTLSKTVSNTPQVSAGYVSSGTAGNSSVSLTANVTTKAAATIYPSASDQSIASGTYLTGAQTIKGVTYSNLTADNIKNGVTVTIGDSADADRIASVTGTYSGGGGGSLTVATKTLTNTATTRTLSFSSLSGEPKYWFLRITSQLSSSGSTTYYYITDLFYDGTNIKGNSFRIGSTRRIYNITSGISQSYSGGTLTITGGSSTGASPGQFYGTSNFGYELVYIY